MFLLFAMDVVCGAFGKDGVRWRVCRGVEWCAGDGGVLGVEGWGARNHLVVVFVWVQ